MTTMVSERRSSFGIKCVHCGDELIAPAWTEYRNERQIHHVWECWSCACCFETIIEIQNVNLEDDMFRSLMVA
jgi:hypothetical protein